MTVSLFVRQVPGTTQETMASLIKEKLPMAGLLTAHEWPYPNVAHQSVELPEEGLPLLAQWHQEVQYPSVPGNLVAHAIAKSKE